MASDDNSLYSFPRNMVVVASAGTGKTHALVGVLVHLLMGAAADERGLRDPVDPSRVVATTFSRKAAAEIRARLFEELDRLAAIDPRAVYRADLAAARTGRGLPAWTDEEVAARARAARDRLGSAQIGTLHSFATSIVRAHALEAGLPPSFEFVDERENQERLHDAIVRVLDERADISSRQIRDLALASGGADGLVEHLAGLLERLFEDGRGVVHLASTGEEDVREIERTMDTFLAHARSVVDDPNLGEAARSLLAAWQREDRRGLVEAAGRLTGVPMRGRKKSEAAEAFFLFRKSLAGAAIADAGRNLARMWALRLELPLRATFFLDLLAACETEVHASFLRDSVLGFAQVLSTARDLLRDHPRVAAEVSAGLDALLVDEFQDTSRLQRELVTLLWDADPSRRTPGTLPALDRLRPDGLLVVGDRKQSIYAFRGADVSVFAEFCVGLAGAAARTALGIRAGSVWEPETPVAGFHALRHNRRSKDELLAFANVYGRLCLRPWEEPAELFEIDYVPATEDLRPPPERPREPRPAPRTTWLRVARRGDRRTSTRIDEAAVIAEAIARIVAAGEPDVRGVPPVYRDIAILANTHDMLDAAAFTLGRAGIPYVVAGRGFYSASEVKDLRSMLALICDPTDKLALLEVLRGPWVGVRDETLLGLTEPHRGLSPLGPAWDAGERRALVQPEDREGLARVRRVVEHLAPRIDQLGPGAVLREAVRALSLDEVLVQLPRGEQRVANVEKLLDMAEEAPFARAFLQRFDEAVSREVSEAEGATFSDEDDAVRLLTVHASKGLDFPIVFLPEAGRSPRPMESGPVLLDLGAGDAPASVSLRLVLEDGFACEPPSYAAARRRAARRDVAERARLAYVAATRASAAMYFVGDRSRPSASSSQAFDRSTAGVLSTIDLDPQLRAEAQLAVLDATPRTLDARTTRAVTVAMPDGNERAPIYPAPALVAPLQDLVLCARRFELRDVLGVPEPRREERPVARRLPDAYGARIAGAGAEVVWEEPFAVEITVGQGPGVTVRGVIDCLVTWKDGSVDALRLGPEARAASGRYDLELAVYRAAIEDGAAAAACVRTGTWGLDASEPSWRSSEETGEVHATLAAARARWDACHETASFPRIAAARCRELGCAYLALCHDGASQAAPGPRQLVLFSDPVSPR